MRVSFRAQKSTILKGATMIRNAIATTLFLAVASPCVAGQWVKSDDKGLSVYNLRDGQKQINMACDPEALWDPPEYHVTVSDGRTFLAGDRAEVKSGRETITLPLSGDSFLAGKDTKHWNKLVAMLTKPGTVTFRDGKSEIAVKIDAAIKNDCMK
ncbi:hypothetical protein [Ensifer sp. SL37]|uniref:hypothetical protein n=1 Tax=Ensifer sp. SL37 TaxID=2995137 RepID=UPI002274AE00|nr:hypothetical protein [Ensifer sp. SL37]MCY1741017.1 hypothetical protein [Ensifer sp. SL37]